MQAVMKYHIDMLRMACKKETGDAFVVVIL